MFNLDNVDLKLLRVFQKVVECGGFSAAQTELHIDLSTISNSIAALEDRLGVRLCDRGRGGFRLTDAGRTVHTAAERLFGAVAEFQAEAGTLNDEVSGELNIGLVDGIVTSPSFALHDAIRRFERRKGNVRIRLSIGLPQDLVQGVRDGRLHLAITGVQTSRLKGLTYRKLCTEDFYCYCGRGHPLFQKAANDTTLEDIYRHRLIAPTYWDPPFLEPSKFEYTATVRHLEPQLIFLLSGDYIGYLPSHFAEPWVAKDELRALLPQRLHNTGILYLIQRRGIPVTRTLSAFENDIIAAFSHQAYRRTN